MTDDELAAAHETGARGGSSRDAVDTVDSLRNIRGERPLMSDFGPILVAWMFGKQGKPCNTAAIMARVAKAGL